MRPRAEARGNLERESRRRAAWLASMRPRAEARGNRSFQAGRGARPEASMRPRAEARGNPSPRPTRSGWSCCFNEASRRSARKRENKDEGKGVSGLLQ